MEKSLGGLGSGREEQWRGIVYSDVIFAAGFAIFVLSDFPPTQRFGLVVLACCIIDLLANLFVLPLLGSAQSPKGDLLVNKCATMLDPFWGINQRVS
jgi:hypothetical protein